MQCNAWMRQFNMHLNIGNFTIRSTVRSILSVVHFRSQANAIILL